MGERERDARSEPEEGGGGAVPDADSVPGSAAVLAAEGEIERPARKRRRKRWTRWPKRAVVAVLLVLVGGVAYIAQTRSGQRFVVDHLLEIARGRLAGDLRVQGVRSGSLLTGLTLQGVSVDAAGGSPFLSADSVVIRYSPLTLLVGSPRVRSTTFFGLDVLVAPAPESDALNLSRVARGGPDSGTSSRPTTIGLGRVSVRSGNVTVLLPADEEVPGLTVPGEDGGYLRKMTVTGLDLDLERTVFRTSGAVRLDTRIASLSGSVGVLEEPLVLREAVGDLTFGTLGIEVENGVFRLPGTLLEGRLRFGPERPAAPWILTVDASTDGWGDLQALAWLDDRVPPGRFRGAARVDVRDGIEATFSGVEAELEASTLALDGGIELGDRMALRSLDVTTSPLAISRLESWLNRDLGLDGFVTGRVRLSGPLEALSATGRLTVVPADIGGGPSTADFNGTLHLGDDAGATGLVLRLDPLNYGLLRPYWADAAGLSAGTARLEINGRLDQGLLVLADLQHGRPAEPHSRASGRGLFRRTADGGWSVDVRADLAPLQLQSFDHVRPDLGLHGSVEGSVAAVGRLDAMRLTGQLTSASGRVSFDGTTDVTDPSRTYRLDADAESLDVSALTSAVPASSTLSGSIALTGSGFALDSVRGDAVIDVHDSRFGDVRVASATGRLRADRGLLTADTLAATVSGVRIAGSGSIGMVATAYGQSHFEISADSLATLRPVVMGDSLLIGDRLSPLEQDLLRARGIDPDTLPTELDVRMEGVASGSADVAGWIDDFDLDLDLALLRAAYGHDQVDSARLELAASALPATLGEWEVDVEAYGLLWQDRQFQHVTFAGDMMEQQGDGRLDVMRRPEETYFARGAFAVDSLGGQVQLEEASIMVGPLAWNLVRPTRAVWSEGSLVVDSLEVRRGGEDPMRLTASGTLTRGGESDFRLDVEGFHVEQALQIAQREDIGLVGHLDLSLTVLGPAERPVIDGVFQVADPRYRDFELARLGGSLQYEDRIAQFRVDAYDDVRSVLTASGTLPIDLALAEREDRTVENDMDVRVLADSLDAGLALGYLSALENVVGTISGDVRIRGTPRDPVPNGTVTVRNAGWTIGALGVRHTGVSGELLVQDATVAVKLSTTRTGTSTVTGLVTMVPFSDPTLDLTVSFERFLAVDRRDMSSTISGGFEIEGTYRLPVARGRLTVDEGVLFVEEFARNAGVVDLSDPQVLAQGLAVDTTAFVTQPLLGGLSNPFLDNLRVDIDLEVPRNMWLRSEDMNVEMGGELTVRYDRREGDLVLIGELQALRGSYLVLGRNFTVQGGTVEFLGQPGVNPTLAIEALSRIRRRGGDRLEVQATVEGTLVEPIVTLSTEEAGLSQSDLAGYIVFGTPAGDLGAAGGGGAGAIARTGGLNFVTGALANQVGSALGRSIGFDYVSFSQGAQATSISSAQVEVGRYVGEDLFVLLVLGPRGDEASDETGGNWTLRGMRVEYAVAEKWFVEGFVEDRFLRSGLGGLGAAGLDGDQVFGAFVFTEWGYGSQQ